MTSGISGGDLTLSRGEEITTLHQEIGDHFRTSLAKALRIGELLCEQKAAMKHGEFGEWIKANVPFTDRTARNYMGLYQGRERLKTETVSDLTLTEGYRLLSSGSPMPSFDDEWMTQYTRLFFREAEAILGNPSATMQELAYVRKQGLELENHHRGRSLQAELEIGKILNQATPEVREWLISFLALPRKEQDAVLEQQERATAERIAELQAARNG